MTLKYRWFCRVQNDSRFANSFKFQRRSNEKYIAMLNLICSQLSGVALHSFKFLNVNDVIMNIDITHIDNWCAFTPKLSFLK